MAKRMKAGKDKRVFKATYAKTKRINRNVAAMQDGQRL